MAGSRCIPRTSAALAALLAFGLTGCASSSIRRFPLREPLSRDDDTRPVVVPCRKAPEPDDPNHIACTPEPYVSPFAWDAADNTLFRPLSRLFAVDPGGEADNVNALDEVADSSWFENRIGRSPISPAQASVGPCQRDLNPDMPDGSWLIDKGKTDGATPGFRVKIPDLGKFMLKADFSAQPERPSAASAIGVRLYHAAGFHVACDSVVYFKPSLLKLSPGLTVTDNSGVTKPFDQPALDKVLASTPHRGATVRMQSSQWLSGVPLGPFKYEGVRKDDPNDIVPHEDRRELRGARLLAAWLNHFDAREQNTMSTWVSADPKRADASPGYVKHYYLDLSDCLGSEWDWDGISRRLGHSYYLDLGDIGRDFVTLGIPERPWDRARRTPGAEIFGYFSGDNFEPEGWKPGYPNPAFGRMTERDGAWMARIIARITPEHLASIVKVGQFSNPRHEQFLLDALIERRLRILRRYLGRLSPVTDVAVVNPSSPPQAGKPAAASVCALDLARWSGAFAGQLFAYQAVVHRVDARSRLLPAEPAAVQALEEGRLCVDLPSDAPDAGLADDDPARYRIVELRNGQARGPLRLHFYDLGPARGLRLVGVERPSS